MVGALFDTNVLIDYLSGRTQARDELARFERRAISIVSCAEVMVGSTQATDESTRRFLRRFHIHPIDLDLADRAVDLRRTYRLKLPDALIWATAQVHGLLLVTRNTKDFPRHDPGVRVPYAL